MFHTPLTVRSIHIYSSSEFLPLQLPLLRHLSERLDLITRLEAFPALKAHATLGALAHFLDVLLDVLERCDDAYDSTD